MSCHIGTVNVMQCTSHIGAVNIMYSSSHIGAVIIVYHTSHISTVFNLVLSRASFSILCSPYHLSHQPGGMQPLARLGPPLRMAPHPHVPDPGARGGGGSNGRATDRTSTARFGLATTVLWGVRLLVANPDAEGSEGEFLVAAGRGTVLRGTRRPRHPLVPKVLAPSG